MLDSHVVKQARRKASNNWTRVRFLYFLYWVQAILLIIGIILLGIQSHVAVYIWLLLFMLGLIICVLRE